MVWWTYQQAKKVLELDEENKIIRLLNKELTQELQEIINSKSWKITTPLRKITSYISNKH